MRAEQIREALRAQPFRPLLVFLSDGSVHEIPHPDFAFVTVHQVLIVKDATPAGVPRRTCSVDPLHVTRIEPMPDKSPG